MELEQNSEHWVSTRWRPIMGWLYMATCAFDFIIAPILWAILQAYKTQTITAWDPLTLKGAGLYHLAMGAILGITSWSRGQEKIEFMRGNGNVVRTVLTENIATSNT